MKLELAKNFTVCYVDNEYSLFDIAKDEFYSLDEEQLEIVKLLNGKFTSKEIIDQFSNKSKRIAEEYIQNLENISALTNTNNPFEEVVIPPKRPYPELHSIHFEITGKCNLECEHCYNTKHLTSEELSTDEIFNLIEQFKEIGIREVVISGGEAILRKDFKEIIKKLINSRIRVNSVFSNGILLNDDILSFLKTCGSKVNLFISLDGLNMKSHNEIRNPKDLKQDRYFETTRKSIVNSISKGLSTRINTIIHRHNYNDLLEIYSYLKQINANWWRLAFPKEFGRYKETNKNHAVIPTECLNVIYQLIDIYIKDYKSGITKMNLEIEMLFRTEILYDEIQNFSIDSPCCQYHMHRCTIKPNGDITRCAYFNEMPIGNIKNDNLSDVWYTDEMQKMILFPASEILDCSDCEFLKYCGAGCRACAWDKSGSFYKGKDELSCELSKYFVKEIIPLIQGHGINLNFSI